MAQGKREKKIRFGPLQAWGSAHLNAFDGDGALDLVRGEGSARAGALRHPRSKPRVYGPCLGEVLPPIVLQAVLVAHPVGEWFWRDGQVEMRQRDSEFSGA